MTDDAILTEIRDRRRAAALEWDPIREQAAIDMRYIAGDPWDATERKKRHEAGRPCLSLDELGQYINQVINDLRANPRGLKFTPKGGGASEKGAEFYQNKVREIEYRSNAQVAYITAAESMIQRSYGWVRVRTKHDSDRSFDQDLWIEPVMNPDQVLPDPDAVWPDSRDMKYLFFLESRLKSEFTREFPSAKIQSFGGTTSAVAPQWISGDKITVGEYWVVEPYTRTLLLVGLPGQPQPVPMFKEELPDGGTLPEGAAVLREREVESTRVRQYLTNGVEILKTADWPGKYIPFASCFGKVLYSDTGSGATRQILSMTRLARDPYMLYCYYRTCEAELVGMTPKFPYFVYKGQLDPDELLKLQKSLHEPIAVIQASPTVPGAPPGTLLSFPARQPYEPPIQGLEMGAEAARRAIQAAMGISPLPTPMQRQNEKSGKALERIESSGQRGSFHFTDHHEGMLRRVGEILEDLITPVLDNRREAYVHAADESPTKVVINDPTDPESISTKGDYLATISTGPATESQRVAAADFVDSLVSNLPAIAGLAGPQVALAVLAKSIRLKQLGPIADQIADMLEPDEFKTKDGKPPNPQMLQARAQIQKLTQLLQQAEQEKQGKVLENQGRMAIEQLKTSATSQDRAADREVKLAVAELGAKVTRIELFLEERARLGMQGHDAAQAALDRAHESIEATKARAHEHIQTAAAQAHAQGMAEQGLQGELTTQAQAAALTPPPEPAG